MTTVTNGLNTGDLGNLEKVLEIVGRDDVQWRAVSAGEMGQYVESGRAYTAEYTALAEKIAITGTVLPGGILKKGESVELSEYGRLLQQHGVPETSAQDFRAVLFSSNGQPGNYLLRFGMENVECWYLFGSDIDGEPVQDVQEKLRSLYQFVEKTGDKE